MEEGEGYREKTQIIFHYFSAAAAAVVTIITIRFKQAHSLWSLKHSNNFLLRLIQNQNLP